MTTADHRTRTMPDAHQLAGAARSVLACTDVGEPGGRRRARGPATASDDVGMQDVHGTPTFLCPVGSALADAAADHRSALITVESGLGLPGAPERRDTLTLAGRLEVRDRQVCDCCGEVRDLVALDLNFVLLARYPTTPGPGGRPESQYRVPLDEFCSPAHDLNRGYLQRSVEHANNCHQDELRRAVATTAEHADGRGRRRHAHQPDGRRGRDPLGRPHRRPPVGADLPAPGRQHGRARRPAARRCCTPDSADAVATGRPRLRAWDRGNQFVEVADRVWVARHEWFDLNISLVGGDRGLLVVDTHASVPRGPRGDRGRTPARGRRRGRRGQHPRALRPHLRQRRVPRGVRRDPDPRARGGGRQDGCRRATGSRACTTRSPTTRTRDEVRETEIVPAEHTFSSARRRWTSATAPSSWCTRAAATPAATWCVRVPDVDVVLAGDLVEESAARRPRAGLRRATPTRSSGRRASTSCSACSTPATVVVPGHGAPVDREFVEEQRNDIGIVAETIRDLAARGVPARAGAGRGRLALRQRAPRERRAPGYEHLPLGQRQLPLA